MDARWREVGLVIDLVSGKWVIRLMQALEPGPLRYSELLRAVPGIGATPLTATLRRMEQGGLVVRHVDGAGAPPTVSYALTGSARALLGPLEGLAEWGRNHGQAEPGAPSGRVAAGRSR